MYRKCVGDFGEMVARRLLTDLGYEIIKGKFHTRYGEIDLIAQEENQLVFIEVKTRMTAVYGSGFEAITKKKRENMIRAAWCYLQRSNYRDLPCRFDILSLTLNGKGLLIGHELVRNAFGVEGGNYY